MPWPLIGGPIPLATLLTLACFAGSPACGQAPGERLTTETAEYCAHLGERLREAERGRPAPREVVRLADEGRLMCDHGEPRRGILRLRRAMQIMMEPGAR